MGRKKKKVLKPWCWYCNREFDDEKILIQHQKAKHFKCHICHKKLFTGPGLAIHCVQVHKETIEKIPNSLPNRGSTEIEIYGMEGIPAGDAKAHEAQKLGKDDEEPDEKRSREDKANVAGMSGYYPGFYPMPGFVPAMPPIPPTMAMPYMNPGVHNPYMAMRPTAPLPPTKSSDTEAPKAPQPPLPPMTSSSTLPPPPSAVAPIRPTFPAYSNSESSGSSIKPSTKPNMIVTQSANMRIIHPMEDLSLEELRARKPKYAGGFRNAGMGMMSGYPGSTGIRPGGMKSGYGMGGMAPNHPMPTRYGMTGGAGMTRVGMPRY